MSESCVVERKVGKVKWFNNKAGYGFITVGENSGSPSDVFVHFSNIQVSNSQYKYLVQGEYVEFTLSPLNEGKHEFQAVQVSGIGGGPTLCESRRVSREETPEDSTRPAPKSFKKGSKSEDGFVPVRKGGRRPK
jgi:cold shock CspA family protein